MAGWFLSAFKAMLFLGLILVSRPPPQDHQFGQKGGEVKLGKFLISSHVHNSLSQSLFLSGNKCLGDIHVEYWDLAGTKEGDGAVSGAC